MPRNSVLGTVMLAGLVLLSGCNQNTSSSQQPGTGPNPSLAQAGNGNDPSAAAPGELSATSQTFVDNAALTDMYEVQAGQIAAMRSPSPDIKQFAQQMIDTHTQHLNELKRLIAKNVSGYRPPPQLDQTRQALLDDLQAANDQVFDARYIAQQADQHMQSGILMRGYIKAGDNPDFRNFAQQTLPLVTMQLQEINLIDRAHHGHAVGAQASNAPARRPRRRNRQAR